MYVIYLKIKTAIKNFLKKTFIYDLIHPIIQKRLDTYEAERNRYFKIEAAELLCKFSEALNEQKLTFWLDFGTLLGYYREHDFIKHDCDLDVGAFYEDASAIRNTLLSHGFKLKRNLYVIGDKGLEETYQYKHTTIDVFYYVKGKDDYYGYTFDYLYYVNGKCINTPLPMIVSKVANPYEGVQKVIFKEADVAIPVNTEEWLKNNYGESFMIPDPSFDYHNSPNITSYSYDEKKGECINYFF